MRPGLQQVKLLLALAAGQVVAPALQLQASVGTKTERAVRAIHLLLHDQVASRELAQGNNRQVLVSPLEAGAFDMMGARIFENLAHRSAILPITIIWFST